MKTQQPIWVAAVLVGLSALVLWITHIGWRGFSLQHAIDPVLLATLAVSIYIAYFLQYYFVSRAAANDAEKRILLDSLRDLLSMVRELRDLLMACYDAGGKISASKATSIKRLFRQIGNALLTVETAISMSHCSALTKDCKEIQQALFDYKAAATGASFPSRPYDAQSVIDQDRTYKALNHKLHDVMFKITRHT